MNSFLFNLLIEIKNGLMVNKMFIFKNKKKSSKKLLHILWNEGFILGYKIFKNKLKVFLKYKKNKPVINLLKFVTKPNLKHFYSVKYLWKHNSIKLFIIMSTSFGLKSIIICKKLKISGFPFFIIN